MPMSKKQLRQWRERMDAIIQNRDWGALFQLEDTGDFALCLDSLIWTLAGPDNAPPQVHTHRVLFLCIQVEDCVQCDSLLNFFDEGFAAYGREAEKALEEIGAPRSAAALRQVLSALPEGGYPAGDWDACKALYGGAFGQILEQADSTLVDYPDGPMRDLYYAYAQAHREDFP